VDIDSFLLLSPDRERQRAPSCILTVRRAGYVAQDQGMAYPYSTLPCVSTRITRKNGDIVPYHDMLRAVRRYSTATETTNAEFRQLCMVLREALADADIPPLILSRLFLGCNRTPENLVAKRSFALQSSLEPCTDALMHTVTEVRLKSYCTSHQVWVSGTSGPRSVSISKYNCERSKQ
jgi:hypothetical protein